MKVKTLKIRSIRSGLLIGISLLLAMGCSVASNKEKEPETFKSQIAQHIEETQEGEVVTRIYEERKNGMYIVRAVVIKDGESKEYIHSFDSNNYTVSIPISARITAQTTAQAEKSPDSNVMVFSQKLDKARNAMMKTDYVSALESLNEALKLDSYNPQAHMMKGSIFYAMGKYDLAKKEFDFVLKVDPDNMEVKRFKDFMESNSKNKKVKIEGIEGQ